MKRDDDEEEQVRKRGKRKRRERKRRKKRERKMKAERIHGGFQFKATTNVAPAETMRWRGKKRERK